MGYVRGLGDVPGADTASAKALHQAALAVIAARNAGNAAALVAAQRSFATTAGTNAQRTAALRAAESQPTGFLENLRGTLTSAGRVAGFALAAILLAPFAIKALGRAGSLSYGRSRRRRSRARARRG